MVEAFGFRVTSDVVGLICIFFAFLYFVLAGGVYAFKETCRKKQTSSKVSNENPLLKNDNDFFKMKGSVEDNVSYQSRRSKSSSILMPAPTSPGL